MVQVALILPWLKPVLAKRQRIKGLVYRCWNIISFSRTRNIPVHAVVSPIPINARHYWQQGRLKATRNGGVEGYAALQSTPPNQLSHLCKSARVWLRCKLPDLPFPRLPEIVRRLGIPVEHVHDPCPRVLPQYGNLGGN